MTRLRPEARNCCASALRSAIRPCLPALFEGADDLREEMTLLALVEPGMAASAQFRAFEPVEHEQRAFDPPQLLECEVELVLVAVGREFSQHDGRRHDAGLQRRAPYRCGRCGCCGSARTAALARRRRGQPPRGSRGCAPYPSHGAFCRSRALDREHQTVSALAQAPVVMLVAISWRLWAARRSPAFRSAEHDVLKQHPEEPEREASRCLVRAAVLVCVGMISCPTASCQGDRCPSFSGLPAIAGPITPLRQLGSGMRLIIVCLYASV